MHRFFVPPDSIDDGRAILPEEVAGQLTRVLRAQSGYEITVLDDSGWEYLVELDHVESKHAEGRVNPNPPKDTDGRREDSGRGWVRE